MSWRRRALGDDILARLLLPDDKAGVAFRAACVLGMVLALVRNALY